MFAEKRPTCVTVIGCVWIILGIFMGFFTGLLILLSLTITDQLWKKIMNNDIPFFYLIVIFQICAGIVGFVSGIYLLKLKAWSRTVLEILTWLILILLVGRSLYWILPIIDSSFKGETSDLSITVYAIGTIYIQVILLGIMLKYLRSDKVKSAMRNNMQSADTTDINSKLL